MIYVWLSGFSAGIAFLALTLVACDFMARRGVFQRRRNVATLH